MASDIILDIGADYRNAINGAARAGQQAGQAFGRGFDRSMGRLGGNINRALGSGGSRFTGPLGRITGAANEFNKSLAASNARVLAFAASAGAVFTVTRAFQSLVRSTVEVEKSLADINVILQQTPRQLENFSRGLFKVAREASASFKSAADAATEFSRQGLGVEETLKRTRDALILSRLSGLEVDKSLQALTSTLNTFNNVALDSTQIINKLATVDAAFAVSSADLAEAIRRVGSSAKDANVSFEQLISLVTAAQQTTARGGAVIGNSLKTIFTRIQRTSVLEQLELIGVKVRDANNQLMPAIDIVSDLARQYDSLSSSTKAYTAELVGGVFQINILKAILGDLSRNEFSAYNRALELASKNTNDAINRNKELNQTLGATFQRTVENLRQLGSNIGGAGLGDFAKGLLNDFNSIADAFDPDSQGNEFGKQFGKAFVKGLVNVLTGPVFLSIGAILAKFGLQFAKFALDSFREIIKLNAKVNENLLLEQRVTEILKIRPNLLQNEVAARQFITQELKNQLLLEQRIAGIARRSVPSVSAAGITTSKNLSGDSILALRKTKLPTFAKEFDGINAAIAREKAVIGNRGKIGIGRDSRLISPSNPVGLGIFNTRDEPGGLSQGVNRVVGKGLDPKGNGIIPNFVKIEQNPGGMYSGRIYDMDAAQREIAAFQEKIRQGRVQLSSLPRKAQQIAKEFDLTAQSLSNIRRSFTLTANKAMGNMVANPSMSNVVGLSAATAASNVPASLSNVPLGGPSATRLYVPPGRPSADTLSSTGMLAQMANRRRIMSNPSENRGFIQNLGPLTGTSIYSPETTAREANLLRVRKLSENARISRLQTIAQSSVDIDSLQERGSKLFSGFGARNQLLELSRTNPNAKAALAEVSRLRQISGQNLALGAVFGLPFASGAIQSSIDTSNKSGRTFSSGIKGIGDAGALAATGFLFGGPAGAGIGAAIGGFIALEKVLKELSTDLPEVTANFQKLRSEATTFADLTARTSDLLNRAQVARTLEDRRSFLQQAVVNTGTADLPIALKNKLLQAAAAGDINSFSNISSEANQLKFLRQAQGNAQLALTSFKEGGDINDAVNAISILGGNQGSFLLKNFQNFKGFKSRFSETPILDENGIQITSIKKDISSGDFQKLRRTLGAVGIDTSGLSPSQQAELAQALLRRFDQISQAGGETGLIDRGVDFLPSEALQGLRNKFGNSIFSQQSNRNLLFTEDVNNLEINKAKRQAATNINSIFSSPLASLNFQRNVGIKNIKQGFNNNITQSVFDTRGGVENLLLQLLQSTSVEQLNTSPEDFRNFEQRLNKARLSANQGDFGGVREFLLGSNRIEGERFQKTLLEVNKVIEEGAAKERELNIQKDAAIQIFKIQNDAAIREFKATESLAIQKQNLANNLSNSALAASATAQLGLTRLSGANALAGVRGEGGLGILGALAGPNELSNARARFESSQLRRSIAANRTGLRVSTGQGISGAVNQFLGSVSDADLPQIKGILQSINGSANDFTAGRGGVGAIRSGINQLEGVRLGQNDASRLALINQLNQILQERANNNKLLSQEEKNELRLIQERNRLELQRDAAVRSGAFSRFNSGQISGAQLGNIVAESNQTRLANGTFTLNDAGAAFFSQLAFNGRDAMASINNASIELAETMRTSFKGAFRSFIDGTNSAKDAIRGLGLAIADKLLDKSLDFGIDSLLGGVSSFGRSFFNRRGGGVVGRFAAGGLVRGGSGVVDDVPAMLNQGDFVIKKSSVQKFGSGFFSGLNRLASGGSVKASFTNRFDSSIPGIVASPELSTFALTDPNNPQNIARAQTEQSFYNYLKQKADARAAYQQQLATFERAKRQRFFGSLINAGVGIAGAGLSSAFGSGVGLRETTIPQTGIPSSNLSFNETRLVNTGGLITSTGVKRFASGGSATDTVPALLTGGEFVINRNAVNVLGVNTLRSLNRGEIPKFQEGGLVNATRSTRILDSLDETLMEFKDILEKKQGGTGVEAASGSINNNITIEVNVSQDGAVSSKSDGTESGDKNKEDARQLAESIRGVVVQEIIKQKKPGGLLNSKT